MTQLELLNRKLKSILDGRKIVADDGVKDLLTTDEIFMVYDQILNWKAYKNEVLLRISSRYHLDFVGWDDSNFNDVLICRNHKKSIGQKFLKSMMKQKVTEL